MRGRRPSSSANTSTRRKTSWYSLSCACIECRDAGRRFTAPRISADRTNARSSGPFSSSHHCSGPVHAGAAGGCKEATPRAQPGAPALNRTHADPPIHRPIRGLHSLGTNRQTLRRPPWQIHTYLDGLVVGGAVGASHDGRGRPMPTPLRLQGVRDLAQGAPSTRTCHAWCTDVGNAVGGFARPSGARAYSPCAKARVHTTQTTENSAATPSTAILMVRRARHDARRSP